MLKRLKTWCRRKHWQAQSSRDALTPCLLETCQTRRKYIMYRWPKYSRTTEGNSVGNKGASGMGKLVMCELRSIKLGAVLVALTLAIASCLRMKSFTDFLLTCGSGIPNVRNTELSTITFCRTSSYLWMTEPQQFNQYRHHPILPKINMLSRAIPQPEVDLLSNCIVTYSSTFFAAK